MTFLLLYYTVQFVEHTCIIGNLKWELQYYYYYYIVETMDFEYIINCFCLIYIKLLWNILIWVYRYKWHTYLIYKYIVIYIPGIYIFPT